MSADAIARLRAQFEAELKSNGDLYHPIDIERVRTEDWQVKRFLLDQADGNEDAAFQALIKALQWKKSFGVHDRTDQYFPKEVWEQNAVEIYGKDKQGRVIQWEAVRNQRVWKETTLLAKHFVAHCIERVDRAAGETGFILITDSNGGGLANVDMDIMKFKIATIDLYPQALKGLYVVDLPWLLNAIMKMIVALMSEKLRSVVHYVKGSELAEVMDEQFIPVELKGGRDKHAFPADLQSFEARGPALGLDEKTVDTFYKTMKLPRPGKA